MLKTKHGKWALELSALFFILLSFGNMLVFLQGPRENMTFLDNPLLSFTMLGAYLAAIMASVVGSVSIIKYKERSILVFIVSIIGFLMFIFLIGELALDH